MRAIVALVHAFALESAFHFVELTADAVRRNGLAFLRPEIIPFKSTPLCEAVASCAAAVALVFDQESAWDVVEYTVAVQVAVYLWVETGVDAVAVALLLFLVPNTAHFALAANLGLIVLLALQPRRALPRALWQHALFMCFLTAARLLAVAGRPSVATLVLGIGVEIAAEAFRQRMYGPVLQAPEHVGCGVKTVMWLLVGVRLADAQAWLRWRPAVPSGLPDAVQGVRFFCDSRLIRGVRFYTGRVVSANTVAISIGEWDEIAFAPNACGFVLALVASLRLPMSLRATLRETDDGLVVVDTRLVFFFFELPPSWWGALTASYAPTSDACMVRGATLLLPSRLTLRRITEALLSWLLIHDAL